MRTRFNIGSLTAIPHPKPGEFFFDCPFIHPHIESGGGDPPGGEFATFTVLYGCSSRLGSTNDRTIWRIDRDEENVGSWVPTVIVSMTGISNIFRYLCVDREDEYLFTFYQDTNIVTAHRQLRRYNIDGSGLTTLTGQLANAGSLTINRTNKVLYYVAFEGADTVIYSCGYGGSPSELYRVNDVLAIGGLAYYNGFLYYIYNKSGVRTLRRLQISGLVESTLETVTITSFTTECQAWCNGTDYVINTNAVEGVLVVKVNGSGITALEGSPVTGHGIAVDFTDGYTYWPEGSGTGTSLNRRKTDSSTLAEALGVFSTIAPGTIHGMDTGNLFDA